MKSAGRAAFSAGDLARMQKVALAAALEAGKVQTKNFRRKIDVSEKKNAGLVTEVDLKSEALILRRLRQAFPDFAIIGEESGRSGAFANGTPVWHVDPLDGTTNYAHGFPMYGVSIGVAVGDEPVMGVVHAPSLRETWWAAAGLGAFHNGRRMHVSRRATLPNSLLATGFAYMKGPNLRDAIERFRRASLKARAVRRPGAAALDLAYVALGVYEGFWECSLSSWDVCAGVALVREAGGQVSDYSGGPFRFTDQEILATNGRIHSRLGSTLRLSR